METMKAGEFQSWLQGQNEHARATMAGIPGRDRIVARLNEVTTAVALVTAPRRANGRFFYLKRLPGENVSKLYVSVGGKERLLADPMAGATGGAHHSIDYFEPSPDGKHIAYGQSAAGSEDSILRVIETATGRDLGEAIDRTQAALPKWRADGRSFFYWRQQKRAPGAPPQARYLNAKAHLHVLGRNPDEDPAVLGRGLNPAVNISEVDFATVHPGAKYALAIIRHGAKPETDFYVAPADSVVGPNAPWRKVADVSDAVTKADIFGDHLYLLTHKDAARFKVLRTSASKPDLARAEVVVPHTQAVITDIAAAQDGLYVEALDGGIGRLLRVPHVRGTAERIALPFDGAIQLLSADALAPGMIFSLTSWTKPRMIFEYEPGRRKIADTGLQPRNPVDLSAYESVQVTAKSHDGTMVPLSIVHKKGLARNGSAPVLLDGYGAYGMPQQPGFRPTMLPWLEHGGVYAMAHVRGGGEFGEEWHSGGRMRTKPNTFLDGIACARYLIEHGYTSAKRIAIMGTSAGGIFAGGAITEAPELFGAAVIRVGLTDMLRIEVMPIGPANVPEFGTVKSAEGFASLLAMSPYHRVKPGVAYPAVLMTAGANDPRVAAWQPAKMAARLQAVSTGKPVLLRVEYDAGHGLGSTRKQLVEEWADSLAFLFWQLGEKGFQRN
jgi:prolyl oligopeptidase